MKSIFVHPLQNTWKVQMIKMIMKKTRTNLLQVGINKEIHIIYMYIMLYLVPEKTFKLYEVLPIT